jgi:hypothetical protein
MMTSTNDRRWSLVPALCLCGALGLACATDDDTDDGGDDGTTSDDGTGGDGSGSGTTGSGTGGTGDDGSTGDSSTGDGGTSTGGVEPPEIVGTYIDSWDITHVITETTWTQDSDTGVSTWLFSVVDNEQDFLVAQNGPDNDMYPGLYSRFDWTVTDGDRLWICQEVFSANTEEDALNAPPPSRDDPENTGCGDWGWTELFEQ